MASSIREILGELFDHALDERDKPVSTATYDTSSIWSSGWSPPSVSGPWEIVRDLPRLDVTSGG